MEGKRGKRGGGEQWKEESCELETRKNRNRRHSSAATATAANADNGTTCIEGGIQKLKIKLSREAVLEFKRGEGEGRTQKRDKMVKGGLRLALGVSAQRR